MAKTVIGESDFIKNLDDWLFKNTQTSATYILKNREGIPAHFRSYNGMLYRGMFVDEAFISSIDRNSLVLNTFTSWTKDINVAKKFYQDKTASGAKARGNIPILLQKKIPLKDQLFDFDTYVEFMGSKQLIMLGMDDLSVDSALKEKEVLINKNIRLAKTDYKRM